MQKHVNLVDLVKSFPTNIFLQNVASIQQNTSLIKFAHLAEKSEHGSVSNLSTKSGTRRAGSRASLACRSTVPRLQKRIERPSRTQNVSNVITSSKCSMFKCVQRIIISKSKIV